MAPGPPRWNSSSHLHPRASMVDTAVVQNTTTLWGVDKRVWLFGGVLVAIAYMGCAGQVDSEDWDDEGGQAPHHWLWAPFTAWGERNRAMRAVRENFWINMFSPDLVQRVTTSQYGPLTAVASVAAAALLNRLGIHMSDQQQLLQPPANQTNTTAAEPLAKDPPPPDLPRTPRPAREPKMKISVSQE
jgi:hypothetical protein